MKSTGIARKIDELGRIVLPIELRRKLNIDVKDALEIYTDDNNTIILRKVENSCIFCGSGTELTEYMGKQVCKNCCGKLTAENAE